MDNQITLVGTSVLVQGLQWQAGQHLRIGRQPTYEVVVNEPSLSKQHAEIRATPQGWIVQDFSSGNTLLNGVPVGKQTRKLRAEDILQCGRHTFRISELRWAPPEASSASWPQNIKTSGPMVRVQALSQLSWEQGLRNLSMEDVPVPHAKQFLTLLRAGYHLSRIDNVNELLQTLLDDTVSVLGAQRGAILLANSATGQLGPKTISGHAAGGRGYSNTLAERCFSKGESFLCHDQDGQSASASQERNGMASIICALLRSPRRRIGVLHLDRGPQHGPFTDDDFKLADAIAATIAVGIESAVAIEKQREQFLQETTELALEIMAVRDPATAGHCQRVAALADAIAQDMRLTSAERQQLKLGALLHDLGSHEEHDREHPQRGAEIAAKVSGFADALAIIRCHHESWDGSGYPAGLKGEAIPRLARVVAVADHADELLTRQGDGPSSDLGKVLEVIRAESGRKFDPAIVAAFQRVVSHRQTR